MLRADRPVIVLLTLALIATPRAVAWASSLPMRRDAAGRFAAVNEHLMSAVLWSAMFFETSSDRECDPDLAVKQLEQIAWNLGRMTPDDRQAFRAFAERVAAAERDGELAAQIRAVVAGLLPE